MEAFLARNPSVQLFYTDNYVAMGENVNIIQ